MYTQRRLICIVIAIVVEKEHHITVCSLQNFCVDKFIMNLSQALDFS